MKYITDIKSGLITRKLMKLLKNIQRLEEVYEVDFLDFVNGGIYYDSTRIKSSSLEIQNYETFFGVQTTATRYILQIENLTYLLESNPRDNGKNWVGIESDGIVIMHNRNKYNCNGKHKEFYRGWRHSAPKEMIGAIKLESIRFSDLNKRINRFMKETSTSKERVFYSEVKKLNDKFK